MTIKDIIIRAFRILDRNDIAEAISAGDTLDGEFAEKTDTLLYCVNAVEDELARYYFPLERTDTFTSKDGKFAYANFLQRPLKILSVKEDGKAAEYVAHTQYFECLANTVTVEYEYLPPQKQLSDKSAYDGSVVGETLIAAGAAAEYCLVSGSVSLSELWESKYRTEIDRTRDKYRSHTVIPPRRWV